MFFSSKSSSLFQLGNQKLKVVRRLIDGHTNSANQGFLVTCGGSLDYRSKSYIQGRSHVLLTLSLHYLLSSRHSYWIISSVLLCNTKL